MITFMNIFMTETERNNYDNMVIIMTTTVKIHSRRTTCFLGHVVKVILPDYFVEKVEVRRTYNRGSLFHVLLSSSRTGWGR
jgi:hypothetical protein